MTKATTEYLKEARAAASAAGLFFTTRGSDFHLFRKTDTRPVFLGKRGDAAGLCSLVKRCAGAK